jgi:hypothetical protein
VKVGATTTDVIKDRANRGTKNRDEGSDLGPVDRDGNENTAGKPGDVPPV